MYSTNSNIYIYTTTSKHVKITGFGIIAFKVNDTNNNDIVIQDILELLSLSSSLLSVSHLHKNSFLITFVNKKMVIQGSNRSIVVTRNLIGNAYELELNVDEG